MLQHTRNRAAIALAGASLLAGAAFAAPIVNGASSRTVDATVKVDGLPTFSGTISGKPYGKGKVTGGLNGANLTSTQTYKNGTVKVVGTVTSVTPIQGTWKTAGGTGKYKKVKGSGTFTGTLEGTKSTLRFKGRAKP